MKAPLMHRRWCLLLLVLSVVVGGSLVWRDSGAPPSPCHEIEVIYEGRDFVFSMQGLDFYRWHYKVVGDSCINRALSSWVIEVCEDFLGDISEVSTVSVDQSDPANGDTTYYGYEIGFDPLSEITGIKWEHVAGNELDSEGEYDTFSFVSPGYENPNVPVKWASKGGQLFNAGYVIGPGCIPVQTEQLSWGRLKAKWR